VASRRTITTEGRWSEGEVGRIVVIALRGTAGVEDLLQRLRV